MKVPPRSRGLREERASSIGRSQKVLLPAQEYLYNETVSGVLLVVAGVVALLWANSPWRESYLQFFHLPITIQIGSFRIAEDLTHWINDGLMAIFFFVVALEIKREFVHGELSAAKKAALPLAAALGGMLLPVGIYLAFNSGGPGARGWGIPMATDIAFAVGILALLGDRVPRQLRMFLLTYAIVDDIGSILVIAIYYTQQFSVAAAITAGAALAIIALMRWLGFWAPTLYLLPAIVFWAAMLKSGIHATIAGVILGFLTPACARTDRRGLFEQIERSLPEMRSALDDEQDERAEVMLGQAEELIRETESPLERLERLVHPWVSFLVLPLFALANAGVELSASVLKQAFASPVTQGIVLALLAGKAAGTTGFAWLAARLGFAELPGGVQWKHLTGAGIIGGIGFTVSLFITNLAFEEGTEQAQAKIGILAASFIAAVAGCVFLWFVTRGAGEERGASNE